MSEEQLSAFFEAVKADAALHEKLKGSADFDGAVALGALANFSRGFPKYCAEVSAPNA
jgi:predicted ribosomally synthesized peptide with nif11-like leader